MAKFVVQIEFTENAELRQEIRPIHREYLKQLLEDGTLHESGPFVDDTGAIIIYEVEDLATAQAILAHDPYSVSGGIINTATIHEWNRVLAARVAP